MNLNCSVIQDLLPLVEEGMASGDSAALVEEHLKTCEACRRERETLKREVPCSADVDARMLEGIRKGIRIRRRRGMAAAALLAVLAVVLVVIHLNSPIYLNREDAVEAITVDGIPVTGRINPEGTLGLTLREEVADCQVEPVGDPEEELSGLSVTCWTTRWHKHFAQPGRKLQVELGQTSEVGALWYCPADGSENALLWPGGGDLSGGFLTLPRLVLNYYLLLALVLSGVGLGAAYFLRRKRSRTGALRLAMIPVCYAIAHGLVLWGKGDVYNALYYLSGILLAAGVLYGLFTLALNWTLDRRSK